MQNNSQPGPGTTNWFQGNSDVFPAQGGAATSYIGTNFNNGTGTSTLSNWLLTPPVQLVNGVTLSFWTRTVDAPAFPDRLQVRMSTNGASTNVGTTATSVGDFTTVLLDINPTYTISGYPNVWTQFNVVITGVASPTQGRLALRYFVENGGPSGVNSDFIGIDTLSLSGGCGTPGPTETPTPTGTPGATGTPCPAGWAAGPAFPAVAVVRSVGVFFPANGKFYSMGGRSSDTAGNNFANPFEFDPTASTWTQKSAVLPDLNVNNMACGVMTVGGTPQIYCVGGSAGGGTTATARVFSYNPATDTITALAAGDDWPGSPGGATATVLPGGFAVVANKLYILGGFDIPVGSTGTTWAFDPTAAVGAKWTQKANYPVTKSYVPAAAIGTNIYTGGGADILGTTVTDSTQSFKYDTVTDTYTAIASIPRATGETRAVAINGKMWVLGGGRVAPNPGNQVDVYDPVANTWSAGTPFVTGRRNFAADTDGTKVWLVGGYDVNVALSNTMEIFGPGACPPTPTPTGTPSASCPPTITQSTSQTIVTGSAACTQTGTGFNTRQQLLESIPDGDVRRHE